MAVRASQARKWPGKASSAYRPGHWLLSYISNTRNIYSVKHLIDLDEAALEAARSALGTRTIKDTVNASLALAAQTSGREALVSEALATLAAVTLSDSDRAAAWH